MRGLPDSVVVGTYKRLTRKARKGNNVRFENHYELGLAIRNLVLSMVGEKAKKGN